eukprot:g16453.t1
MSTSSGGIHLNCLIECHYRYKGLGLIPSDTRCGTPTDRSGDSAPGKQHILQISYLCCPVNFREGKGKLHFTSGGSKGEPGGPLGEILHRVQRIHFDALRLKTGKLNYSVPVHFFDSMKMVIPLADRDGDLARVAVSNWEY